MSLLLLYDTTPVQLVQEEGWWCITRRGEAWDWFAYHPTSGTQTGAYEFDIAVELPEVAAEQASQIAENAFKALNQQARNAN